MSENVSALQRKLWATVCSFARDNAWHKKVDFMFMPVFNAVMTRTLSGYQPISTLCDQDDKNPHRSNLNFRHVALAYQQYCGSSSILAENQQERSSRLKACTKIIAAVVSEVMEAYMDDMQHVPADLVAWCQDAAKRNPSGVLAFCSQWAQTLHHVSHRSADSHPFESKLNLPASIEAVCDLLEEVVKLRPSLVQGAENVCKLGLVINRSAAKKQKDKINKALKSGPEPVQSALDMTDSSDEEQ